MQGFALICADCKRHLSVSFLSLMRMNNLNPRHAEIVVECGAMAETSAYGRSADRAGRRDQVLLPLPKNGDFFTSSLFTFPFEPAVCRTE